MNLKDFLHSTPQFTLMKHTSHKYPIFQSRETGPWRKRGGRGSLGDGKEVDKRSNKKLHRKEGFSQSSENITASNKKSTSKKEPTSVTQITI